MPPVPTPPQQTSDEQTLAYFKKLMRLAEHNRGKYEQDCDRAHAVYRSLLRRDSQAAQWQSQLHPGHAWQKIETLYANLLDEMPVGHVTPDEPSGLLAAPRMECILKKQRRLDERDQKNARFLKQGLVYPASWAKIVWDYEERETTQRAWLPTIDGQITRTPPQTIRKPFRNQPSFVVIPPKDVFWDQAATSVRDCTFVAHRTWQTREHLLDWQERGIYRNVDEVQNRETSLPDTSAETDDRARRQGKIEVLELWVREPASIRVITVANRQTILADRPSPYDHGELPFLCFVAIPDTEGLAGFSVAERIAELQTAYWSLLNQYIDAVRWVGNPTTIGILDDPERERRMAPGEHFHADPGTFQAWHPPVEVLAPLLQAMQELRQEMDDITGVNAFVSGTGGEQVDPKTATEFAGYQGAAQQRVTAIRAAFHSEIHRGSLMEIRLNQQFIDVPVNVPSDAKPIPDPSNPAQSLPQFDTIQPYELVGDLAYDVEDAARSLDEQKNRLAAQQLVQQLAALAPLGQAQGKQLNVTAIAELLGDAYDRKDWSEWFQDAPPPPVMPMAPMGGSGGPPNGAGPPPPPTPPSGAGQGGPLIFRRQPVAAGPR